MFERFTDRARRVVVVDGDVSAFETIRRRIRRVAPRDYRFHHATTTTPVATAISTAREWLRERTLLPADVGDGKVLVRSETPKRIIVGFQPIQPSPIISANRAWRSSTRGMNRCGRTSTRCPVRSPRRPV